MLRRNTYSPRLHRLAIDGLGKIRGCTTSAKQKQAITYVLTPVQAIQGNRCESSAGTSLLPAQIFASGCEGISFSFLPFLPFCSSALPFCPAPNPPAPHRSCFCLYASFWSLELLLALPQAVLSLFFAQETVDSIQVPLELTTVLELAYLRMDFLRSLSRKRLDRLSGRSSNESGSLSSGTFDNSRYTKAQRHRFDVNFNS